MIVKWVAADWPAPSNVHAGTTQRHGGVSTGAFSSLNLGEHVGDEAAATVENRRRFRDACALPSEPVWLHQTHGVNIALEAPTSAGHGTDALITCAANRVCAVLTADCLPVVFATLGGNEVAVAHAGWRGLCAGILEATISAMRTPSADVLAWIGPAISQAAFEVGAEVRQQFMAVDAASASCFSKNPAGRFQADLVGLAKQRLFGVGVTAVFGGEHCTHARTDDFFSFRRDGPTGRMATFVYYTQTA